MKKQLIAVVSVLVGSLIGGAAVWWWGTRPAVPDAAPRKAEAPARVERKAADRPSPPAPAYDDREGSAEEAGRPGE